MERKSATINPDEAVAYGAVVQAAILSDEQHVKHIVLQDVASFSLVIETAKYHWRPLIHKNKGIPTMYTQFHNRY